MIWIIVLTKIAMVTLLALIAELISRTCKRPAVGYAAWWCVLGALILPPIAELPMIQTSPRPVVSINPPANSSLSGLASSPKRIRTPEDFNTPLQEWEASDSVPEAKLESIEFPVRSWYNREFVLRLGVLFAWLTGSLWFVVRHARKYLNLRRLVEFAEPAGPRLQRQVELIGHEFGLSETPTIALANGVFSPFLYHPVLGRARIIVPEQLLQTISPQSLQTILRHELVHYRRCDSIRRLFEILIISIWWWLPIAWFAQRRLHQWEELCTDAEVIQSFPHLKQAYATALLDTEEFLSGTVSDQLSIVPTFSDHQLLKTRIEMIIQSNPTRRHFLSSRLVSLMIGIFLLPIGLLTAGTYQEPDPAKNPSVEPSTLTTDKVEPTDPKPDDAQASISVFVCDQNSKPVPDADVQLLLWWTTWTATEFQGASDQDGKIEFVGIPTGSYLTIQVRHPDFAPIMQDFQASDGKASNMKCILPPSVQANILVRAPNGQPVAGAVISRLEVMHGDSKTVLSAPDMNRFANRVLVSDADGKFPLPPLPEGSKINFMVVHPQWAADWVQNVNVQSGDAGEATLKQGTQAQMNLIGDPQVLNELQGKSIQLSLFPEAEGSDEDADRTLRRIHHQMPIKGTQIEIGVHQGRYNQMRLYAPGYFVTPVVIHRYPAKPEDIQEFQTDVLEMPFLVRKMKKRRGRVVLANGDPVPNISIWFDSLNQVPDQGQTPTIASVKWATAGYETTDEHGYYEVDLPEGLTTRHVGGENFCSANPEEEFEIGKEQSELTDFVLRPLPIVEGVVRWADQQPAKNMVVRFALGVTMMSDKDYIMTDDQGKFQLPVTWQPKGENAEISVLAFDPHSNHGQVATVNLNDPSDFVNVKLELKDQESDWLIKTIDTSHGQLANVNLKEFQAKHASRKPGGPAGELSAGTWFNTEATSLEDFRGKYVLLDFWFIGCGPCVRDFPSVKLAQDLYGGEHFSIVSVHTNSQTPDQVKQYTDDHGMDYPVVVDNAAGDILNSFEDLGIGGFPNYILIDPNGKVVWNDNYASLPTLRNHKLEIIHQYWLQARKGKK